MESSAPLRVCIVAEHASYRFGGEAVLPLHYFSRLRARNIETWLVVHTRTRQELEEKFPGELDRIHFIPDAWFHKVLFRLSSLLPRRISEATLGLLSQLLTQYLQRKVVRKLIAAEAIDIVHQPIPVSPRFPSLMAHLGVPVIIGPMNGGMEYPPAFRRMESAVTRIAVNLGRHFSNFANSLLPGKKHASVLLVANERTRLALPACATGTVIEIPENGVDLGTWPERSTSDRDLPSRRFLFIGRLVDWKGVDMVIRALNLVPDAELEIIGDGPMRDAWQQLAASLGIQERVQFSGWLPQPECAKRLHAAAALVLPSIYECGGAVVLEAMATGTSVIATRWGGPADYVDSSCGILVEPSSHDAIVQGFAEAMQRLIASPQLASELGSRGRQRVLEYFDWEKKVDRFLEISRSLAPGRTVAKPAPIAEHAVI